MLLLHAEMPKISVQQAQSERRSDLRVSLSRAKARIWPVRRMAFPGVTNVDAVARAELAQEVSAKVVSALTGVEHHYSQLLANEFRFVCEGDGSAGNRISAVEESGERIGFSPCSTLTSSAAIWGR